ncbi:MAG TPA: glycosyltransferase family 2 protein [Patescibacteria group bacterium]|jgi:glycosyltransferase involved in cell wall biosynthesis|nr:glycosyltransferase family 2 protein [Patescibacteria group bacterium]
MNKISAIIIARDEEKMIREALESLGFCDEIIVIDNGSTDKTKQISEEKKAKVYEIKTNDFSELRNFGLSKAENDWVLYLDADERIDDELKSSIKKIITDETKYAAYFLRRKNFYFGKCQWPKIEKLERLFKKEKLKGWKGKLHESPIVDGEIGKINEGFILHFTHRDLESMLSKTIEWSTQEALLRYNSGHPQMTWWRFPRVMLTTFFDSYIRQGGYKAGATGIVESMYQSFSMFVTYAKLWELQNQAKNKKS